MYDFSMDELNKMIEIVNTVKAVGTTFVQPEELSAEAIRFLAELGYDLMPEVDTSWLDEPVEALFD